MSDGQVVIMSIIQVYNGIGHVGLYKTNLSLKTKLQKENIWWRRKDICVLNCVQNCIKDCLYIGRHMSNVYVNRNIVQI